MALSAWAEATPVDPLSTARRLRERAATLVPLPDTPSGITRDVGPLAIIEHDGTDYSRLEPGGVPNYAARARVMQRFYQDHGDRYDFVVVFTNFPFDTAGAVGFHNLVRNDVSGIGLPPVNNGPLFGSPGRLKGYVDMGFVAQYRSPPFSMQPDHPGFRDAVNVLAHEIGHQWLAQVRYRKAGGSDSSDLLGIDQSHWSYLLDTDASLFYGSDWVPAGEGVFRAARVRQAYSALDLYLMGLLDPARVAPFTLLRNAAVSPEQLPDEGALVQATPETIDVAQVIAAESPRVPDHRTSQKDFRVGFIVLAAPGADPTVDDLEDVNRLREAFQARFFALTRGVAFTDTTLAEEPLPPPGPPADVDRALAWLRTRQALDGRWEDAAGTALRDTGTVLGVLFDAGHTAGGYEHGQSWMAAATAPNLDFVARRAQARALGALTPDARNELMAAVFAHQNSDGGFGAARGYESDGFDTALALSALDDLGASADSRVRGAIAALAGLQAPDGGWALVPGRGASTLATAQVVLALHDWAELPEASALLTPAIAALSSRQNSDGGFGESPSTALGTALALIALDRTGAPAIVVEAASSWLQRAQLAEGSWNGRSYETALAVQALKGRTAPNLVIRHDDLTLDPPAADEGQVVRVSARVRNVGRVASGPAVVRLYDGAPAATNGVLEVPLPAVEPGQDTIVILDFPTAGRPGTHSLAVQADADGAVAEVREDDNTASRSLEVTGPMADLAIRLSDVVVAPYPPEAGETVQVIVTVVNRGDREATPTLLRLFRGDPATGGIAVGQAALPALGAGSSIAAPFEWSVNGPPGATRLVAIADATFAVAESDETNNKASLPVTITGPVGPGPDLEVSLVEADPSVLSTIPQAITVRIVVRNLGRDPVSSTIALFDGALLLAEQPVALEPRSATVVAIPLDIVSPGSRTLTAVADRAGSVDETNEGNNQASAVVTDPGNTLDVAVVSVTSSSTDLTIGETLTVSATVRNRGTTPLAQVPVVLAHAGGTLSELDRELVVLAPGASTTISLAWTTSFTGDPVPLAVVADPFDLLVETDELNNREDLAVRVRPSALTNLHVSGADITFDPDPPLEGGSATIAVRITNPSPVDAGSFVVRFFLGDPGAGGTLLGEAALSGLAGPADIVVPITWSPVDVRGAQGVFVVVDAAGQVDEYDETDNVGFRPFQVIGLPDLTLSSADLRLDPAYPRVGDAVTVRATVRNLGARPAGVSTLRVFEGEPASGTLIGEGALPALTPGETAEISIAWAPGSPGERMLSALADAADVIEEADEGNNLARRTVVVQDADFYTTAPYFSPDGDGVQDETTLAYRATGSIAVLVSDSRGRLLRTLAENAPAEGSITWDGRDDHGRLMWDGVYAFTLRSQTGGVLGRLDVVLDTNRSPIHEAAGTGFVALRTIDAAGTNARGPAWMPAEDEVLLIIPADDPFGGFTRGLLRWRLDGARSYVSEDPWYGAVVWFASADPVAPDGREVLVTKGGEILAVDLVTGVRRTVGPGVSALWSPDGNRILIGNEVRARDGTPEATLPFGGLTWSPDGEELLGETDIVRRDGSDVRQVPLPVELPEEPILGAPCFGGSSWRGDGRIVLRIGRWTEVPDPGLTEASILCEPDRVFTFDPATEESREVTPLRGLPASDQWSPDGSRLLHPVRPSDAREVTREVGGPSLQLWPSHAWTTPRSSAAFFCAAGPVSCSPYVARLSAATNLLNLTADLTPLPLPGANGVLLKGTATDAHIDRWQVEYAASSSPTTWHPIGAASQTPVIDGWLATWVPSQPGTYLVRLTVWDRAGGERTTSRVVAWSQTPALANMTQSERLISPNDDGVMDVVRFDFLVQEPTRLEARVVGPEPAAGAPGQPPVVRRFSLDLPSIGPSSLVWDGRDEVSQRAADGRYTVFLNEVPFQLDLDATPPEIGLRLDNLRLVDRETTESPGEVLAPDGACASVPVEVQAPGLDRHWHVVDPNLKRWNYGFEWGTEQVYEPERDGAGQIVYVNGVPRVRRVNGRPVDHQDVVRRPVSLEAMDLAGNASSLASAPIATELFVIGLRPQPHCLPAGSPIPKNRFLAGGIVKLTPRTRFFVRGAPSDVSQKRFEYREAESHPWSPGPSSDLIHDDIVDVDLLGLGLVPGRAYRGRFMSLGAPAVASAEFLFKLCTDSISIRVQDPEPIPGTGQSRYVVDLEADVSQPLSVADLVVTGSGTLHGFHLRAPFERTGPTSYRKTVIAPTTGCSASGDASLGFEAVVRAGGVPFSHDGACLDLRAWVGRCDNRLLLTEEKLECSAASPDRVVLKVFAQSPDPDAVVVLQRTSPGEPVGVGDPFAIGTEQACGTVPGVSGPVPLYCDERFVVADVTAVPAGPARFTGRLEPGPPPLGPTLATGEREVRIDRTAPAVTMSEPPEGGSACVERDGQIERVRLAFRVDDDATAVAVTDVAYRYGDGPWRPMCVGQDCGPVWDDLPTGALLERHWDVRGLGDGAYDIRFAVCDHSGNRSTLTRHVSITRGGTAIAVESVANRDFSPNGDGRADDTSVTFRLPQSLRLTVEVRAGQPMGVVVRGLADQQLGPGNHPFAWDGRDGAGTVAADGVYFVVATATNACGGTAEIASRVQLDTTAPVVQIASPASGALVNTTTDVVGRATDLGFASYALSYGAGAAPSAWTPVSTSASPIGAGSPELLGVFQPPAAEGVYTLRLVGLDRAQNESETRTAVNVGPRAFLERFAVNPTAFSPNGDGRRDLATIEYQLLVAGRVTLEVRDAGGGLLQRLESAVDHPEGTYSHLWSGNLTDGSPAPEGVHQVFIRVEDLAGGATAQEQAIAIRLDRTAPSVSIAEPAPGAHVAPSRFVRGTVQDLALREYVLSAERPYSPVVELARGSQNEIDAELASLAVLTEGPYQLVLSAEDAAQNRAEARVPFTFDASQPQALITSPAPATVLDRGPAPVAVAGTATDAYIESYELSFGAGTAPGYFVPIATGTQGVAAGALGSWAVAALSDGPYVLKLVARDRAGQSAESMAAVVLDGRAPEAAIQAPNADGFLNAPAGVEGTASDANLASWRVEAAPGDASTAFQWSLLSEGSVSVVNGPLGQWTPLPPDGRHTLRLTVTDRAGHASAATHAVTVDTVPPAPPAHVGSFLQPQGANSADVVLTWTPNSEPDLAGYSVSRGGMVLTRELVTSATYTDEDRPEGTFVYEVRAVDRAGNASAPASRSVRVDRTPPTAALVQPAAGTGVSGSVEVRGTAFSLDDFAEFRLFAGEGVSPVAWALIRRSTLPVSVGLLGTWTPTQAGPHVLALEAEDQAGNEARITVPVTVDHTPPSPPLLLAVENLPQPTTLTVSWQPSGEPDVIGYLPYRNGHIAHAPAVVIGDLRPYLVPGPAYGDVSLPDGTHCYRVVAMDQAGNLSPPSNEICRSLDNRAPHAVLVEPPEGTRFEFPLRLVAATEDLDVASVRFEVTPAAQSDWTLIAAPDTLAPYEATLDPVSLTPGAYRLRAVAIEVGGESDPSPTPITVTYGDASAPAPPADLAGAVDGDTVSLLWTAGSEPDLAGYHIYRDGDRVTATPQSPPTFAEVRPLGSYEYGVTAVDADGNESLPSTAEVVVYRVTLAPIVPPVANGPVTLVGGGAQSSGIIEVVRGAETVAQAPAGPAGTFAVAGIALQPGPNLFAARERDAAGHATGLSEEIVAIANEAPAAVSGLTASVSSLDVTLDWDPLPDPELFGYHVRRDGQDRTRLVVETAAFQITATDSLDGHGPYQAFDGDPETSWIPSTLDVPAHWTIDFHQPTLVAQIDLAFAGPGGPVPAPAHRLEAEWEGRILPLLEAPAGPDSHVSHTLALPFATTRLRVSRAPATYVGMSEVSIQRLDLVRAPQFTETVPDGVHTYEIAAVDRYGARGPAVALEVPVGDVEAPPTPTGVFASVSGSDVTVSWQPVSAPDLAAYVVFRDAVSIGSASTTALVDAARPNGTYSYTVRSRDLAGNESVDSDPASATVATAVPAPPVLTALAPPSGGVVLSWTHPGASAFAVHRATASGGPYAAIGLTGDVREYVDAEVRPGAVFFYVLLARDAVGNVSAPSNEVTATPLAPRPVMLRPVDAEHPVTLRATHASFGGRAWPGAVVALTVNGELRGVTEAANAFDEVESLAVPQGSFQLRISPDGRTVAFAEEENGESGMQWLEWATGVTTSAPGALPSSFAPHGRRLSQLVAVCEAFVCQSDLRAIDLDTTVVSNLEEGPFEVQDSAWSPDGARIAMTGWDPETSMSRLAVIDVATGVAMTLAEGAGGLGGPRWSPSGEEVAVLRWDDIDQRQELDVIPATGGPAQTVADAVGWSVPAWGPVGRTVVYTSTADFNPRLRSWDLDTGVVSDLSDGARACFDGRIDPSGARLSYLRFDHDAVPTAQALVVRDLASGAERELATWPSEYPTGSELHEWVQDEYLAVLLDGRVRLFPSFDGAFHVPSVVLDPGLNLVEAEGIEVSTGSVSPASAPASVTVPSEVFPDLAIDASDLGSYPSVPLAGQPTVLSARVRNQGQAPAAGAAVNLTLRGPAGVLLDETALVGSIAPGGSTLVSSYWTPPAPGTYLLRAEADAEQQIAESREDNNAAATGIFVVQAGTLSIQVAADLASYPANAAALLTIEVTNGGAPYAGTLRTRVLTPSGTAVAMIDERLLAVGYGETRRLDLTWNTGATLAGDYVFDVRAFAGDTVLAQAGHAFRINPDVAAWTRIVPDDPTVPLAGNAVLRVRVENRGANTVLTGAVGVQIAPQAGGAPVFTSSRALPPLPPGGGWDGSFVWPGVAPAGDFVARAEVADVSGAILATGNAPLEVLAPSGPVLRGTVVLTPSHLLQGVPTHATATVTNVGATSIVGHGFALEVTHGADPTPLVSVPFALDIPAGETRQAILDLPTDALAPGTYLVFLRAAGTAASLGREAFHVHSIVTAPSVDAPPDGAAVPTAHPTLRVNNGFSAGGSALRYEFQLFRDEALTLPLPGALDVPETPNRTSWVVAITLTENASYFWRARATDGFSSSAWTAVASFLVDAVNEPPSAPTPDTPGPGARVASLQPKLIVANAHDPELDPLIYDFRLATDLAMTQVVASVAGWPEGPHRTAWTVPAALIENAHYFWSARAHDPSGSSAWSVPVSFQVDVDNESPSAVPLLRPDDDSEVAALLPELAVGQASDPEGDELVYRLEIDRVPTFDSPDKQVSPDLPMTGSEAAWTAPLPLPDNAHAYWRAAAYDGNTSGPWSYRRFFVNVANDPPGAPVPLDPGAGAIVTTPTPVLRLQNAVDPDLDALTYSFEVRDGSGAVVASVAGVAQSAGQTSWLVDTQLVENGEFTWRARAHDGEVFGPWSGETPFRVNSVNDPPTAPTLVAPPEGSVVIVPRPELVVANASSPDQLPLSYAFELYRIESGGGLTLVESVSGLPPGPASTAWTPSQDLADAEYSWRARAADVYQPGPWMASGRFTVAVDVPPAAPTGLSAIAGDGRVDLAWTASPEPDVTGYRVYRAASSGGPHALLAPTTAPSYADVGLPNGQAVYFVVTAVDASFESDPSKEVSATPAAAPLSAEVAFWPAVLDGECIACVSPGTRGAPSDAGAGLQPLTPVLECVRNDGPLGVTAFFGFENANASLVALPVGPQNFFDPPPADRGQPALFARGRSPEHPGVFSVVLGEEPLTWWLDGQSVTSDRALAVKNCPVPPLVCPQWLYATIEPPAGHEPTAIDLASIRLGGSVPADPTYQALVDRDGDGLLEREVRFAQADARPLLTPGSVPLTVSGTLGAQSFAGGGGLRVAEPKARLEAAPVVMSQSQPGPDLRAWLTLRGCFAGAGIDVATVRLNGTVPVGTVIGIEGGVLKLTFSRSAVLAVLPLGDRVDLVVTGTAQGQAFRSVDQVRVVE